jgi:predicted PurR-regulated permease PerM
MKIEFNKKFDTIAFYVAAVFAVCLAMVIICLKWATVSAFAAKIVFLLAPIGWGVVFAYLMNPVLIKTETVLSKYVFRKKPHPKASRVIAVAVCLIVLIGIIAAIFALILPGIIGSLNQIYQNLSKYIVTIQDYIIRVLDDYPELEARLTEELRKFQTNAMEYLYNITQNISTMNLEGLREFAAKIGGGALTGALNILNAAKDAIIGLIIMIYLLFSKELFIGQAKKLTNAFFPKPAAAAILRVSAHSNRVMGGFINGKIIDSVIIGILCFIGMSIMKMEYVVLISVIVGVTNIIPFFGPFIGAIPSGLLLLIAAPEQVLPFCIFILALQQFDGNILGPKILGDTTGLPAFWVMVAIFLGGGLFGFGGMILGVPIFAVIYTLIKEITENQLRKKSLPVATTEYMPYPVIEETSSHKSFKLTKNNKKSGLNTDDKNFNNLGGNNEKNN